VEHQDLRSLEKPFTGSQLVDAVVAALNEPG
jgi:hypothetical protein